MERGQYDAERKEGKEGKPLEQEEETAKEYRRKEEVKTRKARTEVGMNNVAIR